MLHINAIFLWFNLVIADNEIFQPFLVSPNIEYSSLPPVTFLSNALLPRFPENVLITRSSPSRFTNREYTTKVYPSHCDNTASGIGCLTSQLFDNADLLTGYTASQLARKRYAADSSNTQMSLGAASTGPVTLPISSYDTVSTLQSTFITDGSTHKQSATAQGFHTTGSTALQSTEGSTLMQPTILPGYLEEQPFISASTNLDVSGGSKLSSNGYVSLARPSTLQTIEGSIFIQPATLQQSTTKGNTYLQSSTVQGYLRKPVISVAPNPAIELFVKSLTQALTSNNLLKDFIEFEHQKPGELLHGIGMDILSKAGIDNPNLPKIVAEVGDSIGTMNSYVYLDAQVRTVAKFLDSRGLLSIDTVYPLSQTFISFVENRANAKAVVDTESLLYVVINGFVDFVKSLGYLYDDTYEEVYKLFSEELKAAHFNAASQ